MTVKEDMGRRLSLRLFVTANNVILNVGRAIGGFSSVIIGKILDVSSVSMVMIFLASLYLISFAALWTIRNLKSERYSQLGEELVAKEA